MKWGSMSHYQVFQTRTISQAEPDSTHIQALNRNTNGDM
jgi:hypothetical protein